MALTINGKKSGLKRRDFDLFADKLNIPEKVAKRIIANQCSKVNDMIQFAQNSFLPSEQQQVLATILRKGALTLVQ